MSGELRLPGYLVDRRAGGVVNLGYVGLPAIRDRQLSMNRQYKTNKDRRYDQRNHQLDERESSLGRSACANWLAIS